MTKMVSAPHLTGPTIGPITRLARDPVALLLTPREQGRHLATAVRPVTRLSSCNSFVDRKDRKTITLVLSVNTALNGDT